MTHHPYWTYGPDTGTPVVDAVDEGRRLAALELATRTEDTGDGYLARARRFEAYLKGTPEGRVEVSVARLADLEKSERKLIALEVAGVDNWSGYDEAVADLDDES